MIKLRTVVGIDAPCQENGLQHPIPNPNKKPFTDELDNNTLSLVYGLNGNEMTYRWQPIPIALKVNIKWRLSQKLLIRIGTTALSDGLITESIATVNYPFVPNRS